MKLHFFLLLFLDSRKALRVDLIIVYYPLLQPMMSN